MVAAQQQIVRDRINGEVQLVLNRIIEETRTGFANPGFNLPTTTLLDMPQNLSRDGFWMSIAEGELGVAEIKGGAHNSRIIEYHSTTGRFKSDEVPWCSSFVNWTMESVSINGTGSASSLSWKNWGQRLDSAAYGSIAIIDNGNGTGHVGFVAGVNSNGSVVLLGGNQGNMVRYSSFSNITSYVYPTGYTPNYNLRTLNINLLNISTR